MFVVKEELITAISNLTIANLVSICGAIIVIRYVFTLITDDSEIHQNQNQLINMVFNELLGH